LPSEKYLPANTHWPRLIHGYGPYGVRQGNSVDRSPDYVKAGEQLNACVLLADTHATIFGQIRGPKGCPLQTSRCMP
jgi:hypothetical protein